MTLFNKIFSRILDTYYINIDEFAMEIDRHPSRIRHWKTDSKPGKYIIDTLSNALIKQIQFINDDSKNKIFMDDIIQIIEFNTVDSDSLLAALNSENTIESFIKALIHISYSYDNKTHNIHKRKNSGSSQINQAQLELDVRFAQAFEASGDFESAKNKYLEILETYKSILDPHMRALIYSYIGFVGFILLQNSEDSSFFDETVRYYTLCIKDFNKLKYPLEYAIVLKKFGSLHLFQSEFFDSEHNIEKALHYYNEALKYAQLSNSNIERLKILHNIALAYTRLAINIDPLVNVDKSIQLFNLIFENDLTEVHEFKAQCEMNIGLAYSSKIKLKFSNESAENALRYLNSALNYFTLERNPHYYAIIKNSIGMAYTSIATIVDAKKNNLKALDALKEVLWIYSKHEDHRVLFIVHNNLVSVYIDLFILTTNEDYLIYAKLSIDYLEKTVAHSDLNVKSMSYFTLLGLYNSALYEVGRISSPDLVLQPFDRIINHHKSKLYPIHLADCINSKCNALLNIYNKSKSKEYLEACLLYKDQLFDAFNALSSPIKFGNLNIFYGMVYSNLYQHQGSDLYKELSKEHYDKAISIFNKTDYVDKNAVIRSKINELQKSPIRY